MHPGWSVVGSRPGTQKPDNSTQTTNLNLLDTTKHNSKDTVNRTMFSPSTSDFSKTSSSICALPTTKYIVEPVSIDEQTFFTEDETFLVIDGNENDETEVNCKPPPCSCSCHGFLLGSCPGRIENVLALARDVSASGMPNRDLVKTPVGFLNTPIWKEKLNGYDDSEDVLNGIEYGWELGRKEQPMLVSTFRNHQSADENSQSIEQYIEDELADGNLVGPLPSDHGLNIIVSPLGSVPKPGSSKRRTIVDSSFPPGHGVNDSIPKNIYRDKYLKVELPTVDDIVAGIRRVKLRFPGQKLLGYKLDLSKYYRYITTCPRDWPVQCIKWKGNIYMDTVWSFGLRSAVQAAQRTSSAVNWIFKKETMF